jgi:glycine betaine/choline ABC-type transport system substrate-binding protein
MQISNFISKQITERQILLNEIHEIIIQHDKTIQAEVEPMMGKEMIVYKASGVFK